MSVTRQSAAYLQPVTIRYCLLSTAGLFFLTKRSQVLTHLSIRELQCSGTAPCENCRTFHRVCVFDESLDQRRRVAAKRTADELSYHRDLLNDIFKLVREADEGKALDLLEIIRHDASADELRAFINETLSDLDTSSSRGSVDAASKLESMRDLINVEGTTPTFRRKVMDIHYLCDEAPIKVPARPWTNVTRDDDLISHLVSLYFTWDYPFNAFLDQEVFLRHMTNADLASQFCSPFLVNALLSNACVGSSSPSSIPFPILMFLPHRSSCQ